jgi:hypothetical protein
MKSLRSYANVRLDNFNTCVGGGGASAGPIAVAFLHIQRYDRHNLLCEKFYADRLRGFEQGSNLESSPEMAEMLFYPDLMGKRYCAVTRDNRCHAASYRPNNGIIAA